MQGVPPGEPTITPTLIEAWVWPAWGDNSTGAINDPGQPYQSIQDAIDALHAFIMEAEDPLLEGLVWCMPGLYGPAAVHGADASDDGFPIVMKHRVHVKGVSARRCVIRGVPTAHPLHSENLHPVALPLYNYDCVGAPLGAPGGEQVLVTFSEAHKYHVDLGEPDGIGWYTYAAEVDEVLDGFTFQGGGIQVSFDMGQNHSYPLSGRISNCIFDLRDMPSATPTPINGAEVGLSIGSAFTDVNGQCGYWNQRVHVVNNTFILAEYGAGQWRNDALNWAVGILNYGDPESQYYNIGSHWDGNLKFRGLGNPGIQNNLFRTRPANLATGVGAMAMVGVDSTDCLVREGGSGTGWTATNAFAPSRAGSSSGPPLALPASAPVFVSVPVVPVVQTLDISPNGNWGGQWVLPIYYDVGGVVECSEDGTLSCTAAPAALPAPGVALWNGSPTAMNERDPGFVGEFLVSQPGTPVLADYADWRLLPGSPLIDQGRIWEINEFANGVVYRDHPHEKLSIRRWDGEGWGNMRVHGTQPDIGFDEFHLGVMAGSYANGCNSHNKVTHLNPSATASQAERRILLPQSIGGTSVSSATLRVKATERQVALPIPPWTMSGWSQPPVTLASPLVNNQLPAGYQTAYINLSVERWTIPLSLGIPKQAPPMFIPNSPFWTVIQVELPLDDEGPNYTSHFNTQFVLEGGAFPTELRGNLQPEYR